MDDKENKPSSNTDPSLIIKTMRWLWLQKQTYQFVYKALNRKRLLIEEAEKEALKQALFFKHRMVQEMKKHPNAFNEARLKMDNEGEEWKGKS